MILRWPTPRSKDWTERLLGSARGDTNIRAVIAIGSAVRPAVTSTDLDLLVITNEPLKLKVKPPIEVDQRVYAQSKVDTLIESGNDMLGWAVVYGKVLFQRDGYWDHVLARWQDRVPLPSAKVALQRAVSALHRLEQMIDLGDVDAAFEQAISSATHLARAELLKNQRYPASRPELPGELRKLGSEALASCLEMLINRQTNDLKEAAKLLESLVSKEAAELSPEGPWRGRAASK